jgi:hypothetical protein
MESLQCVLVVGKVPSREWLTETLRLRGYVGVVELDVGLYAVRQSNRLAGSFVVIIETDHSTGLLLVPGHYGELLEDTRSVGYVVEEPAILCPGSHSEDEATARGHLAEIVAR